MCERETTCVRGKLHVKEENCMCKRGTARVRGRLHV